MGNANRRVYLWELLRQKDLEQALPIIQEEVSRFAPVKFVPNKFALGNFAPGNASEGSFFLRSRSVKLVVTSALEENFLPLPNK